MRPWPITGRPWNSSPTTPTPSAIWAWSCKNKGTLDEAVAHYRKAVELKPDFAEAHYSLGMVLQQQGKIDEAIVHYRKALESQPDLVEVRNNLGIALAGCGKADEAIVQYQKALEIKPDFAEVHNNLAGVLVGRGQADQAIAHYQKALEINPDYVEAHDNLGLLLGNRKGRSTRLWPSTGRPWRSSPTMPKPTTTWGWLSKPRQVRRSRRPVSEGPGGGPRVLGRGEQPGLAAGDLSGGNGPKRRQSDRTGRAGGEASTARIRRSATRWPPPMPRQAASPRPWKRRAKALDLAKQQKEQSLAESIQKRTRAL